MTARMDSLSALKTLGACEEAKTWLREERARRPDALTARERWEACPRADWLLWLAGRANVDRKMLVMAGCACARLALVYVPSGENRPRVAIETAERWCAGGATVEEAAATAAAAYHAAANAAYYAARAANAAYPADHAAYNAANAAYYAARAANAAYPADHAAYRAANAACAADHAACAAANAANAAYYAADHAAYREARRTEMRASCAAEVRRIIPWADVERGVFLAAGGVL